LCAPRDFDVEAQADGWDETSTWGYDHVVRPCVVLLRL
jgi:hypothetical protein